MASLLSTSLLKSGPTLGTVSASSLVKSATTLQNELATLNDDEAEYTYENSAKTASDLSTYTDYLNTRIDGLQSSGTVTDTTKAVEMSQKIVSATHENISADIARENIQVMSSGLGGTASGYQGKMNVVSSEYTRALSIGDDALAQSLMSQYYSLSQSYQNAVTSASDAASTLSSTNATHEGDIVTNLNAALKSFQGTAKNLSENELNSDLSNWAKQNAGTMASLGVKINASQPNYWDVVAGIAGGIYNAKVLQAQAESATNPLTSATYAQEAQDYLTGATKISTLGGDLTVQQIAQAQQDPNMFAYDDTSGTYKETTQTGYQYITETDNNGQSSQVLAPTYSGIVGAKQANKVFFLSPTQTTQMTKLGLNFSENTKGTTGDGVVVQASANTPSWLTKVIGQGGETQMFVGQNGYLEFKAGAETNNGVQGETYYVLAADQNGKVGVYEANQQNQRQLVGGEYGFDPSGVNLLINQAQQLQHIASVKAAALQTQLASQITNIPAIQAKSAPPTVAQAIQKTAAPQLTFNPQAASKNAAQTLQPTSSPQQTGGANLNQSGTGGIKLTQTSETGIKL